MENETEGQVTQNEPEVIQVPAAELAELKRIAEASTQNFSRAKAAEEAKKELAQKLAEKGEGTFDSSALKREIEDKVSLRLSGFEAEHIEQIEKFAKGAGISLTEAAQHPLIKAGIEGLKAEKKSTETSPAPSNKIKVFNGKPVDEIFKTGSAAEKQAAWEASIRGGVKSNE